ncbi:T9SS type A sorting domain-containing protein [bacterium]|nr:T9SS type A sorting domain-containing protein [bacterium]
MGGPVLSTTPDFTLNFDPACYPFFICSLGDINHDGYGDLAVVDDFCNNGWGTFMAYLGHPWLNSDPVLTINGREPPLNLIGIRTAAGLGDVNNDGIDDWAIGAANTNFDGRRGRAVVISGDTTMRVDVDDPVTLHPSSFILSVYPNPFNSSATFTFELLRTSPVTLSVFNTLGQRVGEVNLGQMAAGDLPSGVYLARVETAGRTETRKVVLLM